MLVFTVQACSRFLSSPLRTDSGYYPEVDAAVEEAACQFILARGVCIASEGVDTPVRC